MLAHPRPTGLYGVEAAALQSPYSPLDGDGLVLPNPPQTPYQAFSRWLPSDVSVVGFVSGWGCAGDVAPEGDAARRCFGRAPAPVQLSCLEGSRAWEVSAVKA